MVSLRPLKELVLSDLPQRDVLRDVILSERDELTPQEFLAKLEVWLAIRRSKKERSA
ncbi:MAG: hypothetical protein HY296_04575 [Thaumarchaeota archaeon]|nr:hypothetical protein [Nitrososphaerota archaeon]